MMKNSLFVNITNQCNKIISNQPIIHKIYSKFTFLYYPYEIISKNDINHNDLRNLLKESKLITYFHTKSPQTLEFSSIFYDQNYQTPYKSPEFIVNTTLCIESYCILIHCSDISQITKLLFETKSNFINLSGNAQKSSQDVLAIDEAKNIYKAIKGKIKNSIFIKNTIYPISSYIIRRHFYPSNHFKDSSFFRYDEEMNVEVTNDLNKMIFEDFQTIKNIEEMKNKMEKKRKEIEIQNNIQTKPKIYEFSENDFITLRNINTNEESSFILAIHIKSLYIFVLKLIKNHKEDNFAHEKKFCNNSSHRCFTRFYGFIRKEMKIIGFVYEFMSNGDLESYIKRNNENITNSFSLMTMIRLFEGIEYLHSNGLIHRDLKPSNILLDHDLMPYIYDYETIKSIKNDDQISTYDFGTLLYESPEQYYGRTVSYPTDIYSFGLIVYFIFEKRNAFNANNNFKLIYNLLQKEKLPKMTHASENIQNIYILSVKLCPSERISLESIGKMLIEEIISFSYIEDYFINSNSNTTNGIIQYLIENILYLVQKNDSNIFNEFVNNLFAFNELHSYYIQHDKCDFFLHFGNRYFIEKDYSKAKKLYELSAQLNNSKAINNLGVMYENGFGMKQDYIKSKYYYKLATKQNDPNALFNLGHFYFDNKEGIEKNRQKAMEYLISAAKQDDLNACFNLGIIYLFGSFIEKDNEKALHYFEFCANHNFLISFFILGYVNFTPNEPMKSIKYFDLYDQKYSEKANSEKYILFEETLKSDYFNQKEYFDILLQSLDSSVFYNLGLILQSGRSISINYLKAKSFYELAAKLNNSYALVELCFLYLDNKIGNYNYKKGFECLESAAQLNNRFAILNIGILYKEGKFIKNNYHKAKEYFEKAANLNEPFAFYYLGEMYLYGEGVKQDVSLAQQYLDVFYALKDETDCIIDDIYELIDNYFILGVFYYQGIYIKQDYSKSLAYFELSAKRNNSISLYNLGLFYANGIGVEQNIPRALHYFELSAKKNNTDALLILGTYYYRGIGVAKNLRKAREYLELAAKQNNSLAYLNLGVYYMNYNSDEIDIHKALYYLEKAASLNNSTAQFQLANVYFIGHYVKPDIKKALHYLKLSSKQNNPLALYQLGYAYFAGEGVVKSYSKAEYYYKKAALFGNVHAMDSLGDFYYDGIFVKQNIKLGLEYYKLAAEKNSNSSLFSLGNIYSSGEYIDMDINKAIHYFKRCIQFEYESINFNFENGFFTGQGLQNFYRYPSYNNLGLIYLIEFNDIANAMEYIKQAGLNEYPFGQNNFGLLLQYFCQNRIDDAEYMYKKASEHNFPIAEYNLGNLKEEQGDLEESIKYFIRASNHEHEDLECHGQMIIDTRIKNSIKFIVLYTKFKLVDYFYSIQNYKESKKYFIKAISEISKYSEFRFECNKNDDGDESFSYIKDFILNFSLFNLENQPNIKYEKTLKIQKSLKQNKHLISNKIDQNETIDFIDDEKLVIKDPGALFDYALQNEKRFKIFINCIKDIIEIMKYILYTYPYHILFGRIYLAKERASTECKNIDESFYDGLGII